MVDSRVTREGAATRRRRECLGCGFRFTTYEYIEPEELRIVKRDKSVENYSREKLKHGIRIAFAKRPFNNDEIDKLVDRVESSIISLGPDIESHKVGELVMHELALVDEVAYIRFASVYKRFHVTGDFREELDKLKPSD